MADPLVAAGQQAVAVLGRDFVAAPPTLEILQAGLFPALSIAILCGAGSAWIGGSGPPVARRARLGDHAARAGWELVPIVPWESKLLDK